MQTRRSGTAAISKQTTLSFPAVKPGASSAAKPAKECQTKSSIQVNIEPIKPSRKRKDAKTSKGSSAVSTSPTKSSKRAPSTNTKGKASTKWYDSIEWNGVEWKVGQDVYLAMTDDQDQLPAENAADMCVSCSKGSKAHTIIECDRCLGGYHMACLKPPLKKVPEGVWLCPCCERGDPPASSRTLRTAYEKFLFSPPDQPVLSVARIMDIQKKGDGQAEILVRFFCLPEETYLGRQSHHRTREVFLSAEAPHWEPLETIFTHAHVVAPKDFDGEDGLDVFMCEYEYDGRWKRFRRCNIGAVGRSGGRSAKEGVAYSDDEDDSDDDFNAGAESLSDNDSDYDARERNFKPIYAFWAEKGMLPAGFKGRRPPARAATTRPAAAALNRQAAAAAAAGEGETDGGLVLVGTGAGAAAVPQRGPTSPLAAVRQALALSAVPDTLLCRDHEKGQLTQFLDTAVTEEGGSPGVLYVCGVPGTGKTACINEVLAASRPKALEHGVQLVFINALSLPTPGHVYTKLWEKLTGQRMGPARALLALDAMFSSGSSSSSSLVTRAPSLASTGAASGSGRGAPTSRGGPAAAAGASSRRACMTVLVVDEIDVLITKDQEVLYNLFEWPTRQGARFAVIGVSNTHDLDERVLPRIQSRLASAKLVFSPYNVEQLSSIVKQRLAAAGAADNLVDPFVIQIAVRKVAATTGDVRRALEILRRAVEIGEQAARSSGGAADGVVAARAALAGAQAGPSAPGSNYAVKVEHVNQAQQEIFNNPQQKFLKACSLLEKLVLAALLMEMKATSKGEATIQAVHHRLCTHVALIQNDGKCEAGTAAHMVFNLANKRLVLTGPCWQGIKARVALAIHRDDVVKALREDGGLEKALLDQLGS